MKTVDSLNFAGHRAVIRVDFNVPLDKQTFAVTDNSRITGSVKTIHKILNDGGSAVLMSHLGRPKEGPEDKYSLKHIVDEVSKCLGRPVKFAADCISDEAFALSHGLQAGEVLLLENLRFYKEEEKGDAAFAEKLSRHGDVYINDAFGTAHRAHASTTIIANYFDAAHKMFGYLMAAEVESASKIIDNPQAPFTAIIGGAKVSDKILILENLLNIADNIIIGGGMAYTFMKAMGGQIGKSLCEDDRLDNAKALLEKAAAKGVHIYLPEDSICADNFAADAHTQISASNAISDGWMGLDIGPKAIEAFCAVIKNSKTILWNGPTGVFEMEAFAKGTGAVAHAVADATQQNGAYSLIGGGDSVAAIHAFHLGDKVSYVSTGGGALLEVFEGKVLPGVAAIEK